MSALCYSLGNCVRYDDISNHDDKAKKAVPIGRNEKHESKNDVIIAPNDDNVGIENSLIFDKIDNESVDDKSMHCNSNNDISAIDDISTAAINDISTNNDIDGDKAINVITNNQLQNNNNGTLKRRSTYNKMRTSDMGVPGSPVYDENVVSACALVTAGAVSVDNLNFVGDQLNHNGISSHNGIHTHYGINSHYSGIWRGGNKDGDDFSSLFRQTLDNSGGTGFGHSSGGGGYDFSHISNGGNSLDGLNNDKLVLIDGTDLAAQNRRLLETDENFFYNRSSQSPLAVYQLNSDSSSVNSSNENTLERSNSDGNNRMQMSCSTQSGHYFGTADDDSSKIDRSPIDFRRNFEAIERAAMEGSLSMQENAYLPARRSSAGDAKNGDEDPYSYYWSSDGGQNRPDRLRFLHDDVIGDGQIRSPDSHDSGIHVDYVANAAPLKQEEKFVDDVREIADKVEEAPPKTLPSGWEKHEDPGGFSYYWHVDSGTVQREHPADNDPLLDKRDLNRLKPRHSSTFDSVAEIFGRGGSSSGPSSAATRSPSLVTTEQSFKQTTVVKKLVERAQSTTEHKSEDDRSKSITIIDDERDLALNLPVRFAVRSLGWTEVNDEDLTPERSSRAVNKAIIDLSTGRKDFIDNVSKWGDGKELILELDDRDLRLIDPESGAILHTQLIYQIRVWGVGRDNGRDFAYVARDRMTRRYMCHVFRCDTPARTIANTLRDICKRLMVEQQRRPSHANFYANGHAAGVERRKSHRRPSDLPRSSSGGHTSKESFPAPMEEPKKIVRCHFIGVTQVTRATGIDVLNEAVDRLVTQVREDRWLLVDVSISPSTINIIEVGNNQQIAECRVRYLSFLGIGRDIKHCAYIMQNSTDGYMCYVFHVEPSAGAMAKTIEAACKLRYQKVLDAHGERRPAHPSKGWTDTIKDVFGSFTGKKSSRSFSLYPR